MRDKWGEGPRIGGREKDGETGEIALLTEEDESGGKLCEKARDGLSRWMKCEKYQSGRRICCLLYFSGDMTLSVDDLLAPPLGTCDAGRIINKKKKGSLVSIF